VRLLNSPPGRAAFLLEGIFMSEINNTNSKLLNYKEAAAYLRIHEASLRRLVSQKKLGYYKIGHSVRFSLEQLLDANENKAVCK